MLNNKINLIWLALVVATLITFGLGESGLAGRAGIWTVLLMFVLAYGKGMLVILDFMELRHAPALWRRLMVGWLSLVLMAIVLAYWLGSRWA